MLEILKFIFSSFWIWMGTAILLTILGEIVDSVVKSIFKVIRDRRGIDPGER